MSYSNIRRNAIVGIIEDTDLSDETSLHFSEWWNGEGFDFHFDQGTKRESRIALTCTQIRMLATAAHAAGYLDLDEIEEKSQELLSESRKRARRIEKFRNEYQDQ